MQSSLLLLENADRAYGIRRRKYTKLAAASWKCRIRPVEFGCQRFVATSTSSLPSQLEQGFVVRAEVRAHWASLLRRLKKERTTHTGSCHTLDIKTTFDIIAMSATEGGFSDSAV